MVNILKKINGIFRKKPVLMKKDERCLGCEEVMRDPEFGHGGDPCEAYEEGFHLCKKKQPRIVRNKQMSRGIG